MQAADTTAWRSYVQAMVSPWPAKSYTFRALTRTFGPLWVRCDVCRRHARLHVGAELREVDYRTRTFSCSRCGTEASVCVIEPVREKGMDDHRLDELERPERHPAAVERLTGRRQRPTIDYSGGELPGRKVDGRR